MLTLPVILSIVQTLSSKELFWLFLPLRAARFEDRRWRERRDFVNAPYVVRDSGFHCGSATQRLMNSAEVLIHEVQGHLISMVFDLFAERICEARKPPYPHPHREVLPFRVARGNVLGIGTSLNLSYFTPDALRGTVARLFLR
jgi:hypothetical protein